MAERLDTQTQDAARSDGWSGPSGRADAGLGPRIRLLYHSDLDRIGAITLVSAAGRWLEIGRLDPVFTGVEGGAHPIADPLVSREQLRVRWLPEVSRFEIEPSPAARRPLILVDLETSRGAPEKQAITRATQLEVGTCVAIGDRVLLGFELGRALTDELDRMGLVGDSEIAWKLRDEIRSIASFGRSALIMGPTGSGKELIARALHAHGARAHEAFVPVNCAAIPEKLFESVLFGHVKGAFSGADAEGKGLFRTAERGTLFLDEIGELPLEAQPKLLRVLQDGVVIPVGAAEGRTIDVGLIAATNRDLVERTKSGALREDLYHRLAAHVIRAPALSERRFDIPELLVHMLGRHRGAHPSLAWLWEEGRSWQPALPIRFIAELMGHDFKGNVRELENLAADLARLNLERGTFREPVSISAVSPPARAAPSREPSAVSGLPPETEALVRAASESLGLAQKTVLKLTPPEVLLELEREAERGGFGLEARASALRARATSALVSVLETHDYHQSVVANALGTSRTTLVKLMDDLGLPRATDLTAEEILRARAEAGGDIDAAAKILRVSSNALRKRLTILNLKARGR
jgi:DNA-binding NtrC family response regulator